jgi:hypothetical protein
VDIEEEEEIRSKGTNNTFNKRTRNFPILVIERDIQTRKLLETDEFRKRNNARHILFKTQNRQNEKDFLNCKKKDISQL